MTEQELLRVWISARRTIIVSQLAPTGLLAFTVWLGLQGLGDASLALKLAATGILLASGVLGALAQYTAATEALGASRELAALSPAGAVAKGVVAAGPWMNVVRFVTPAIFVLVFVALLVEFFV
jgi:hypothetical protein